MSDTAERAQFVRRDYAECVINCVYGCNTHDQPSHCAECALRHKALRAIRALPATEFASPLEDVEDDRPWRGVFVLRRPQRVLFNHTVQLKTAELCRGTGKDKARESTKQFRSIAEKAKKRADALERRNDAELDDAFDRIHAKYGSDLAAFFRDASRAVEERRKELEERNCYRRNSNWRTTMNHLTPEQKQRIEEIRERRTRIPLIGYLVTALSTLRGGDECVTLLTSDIDFLFSLIHDIPAAGPAEPHPGYECGGTCVVHRSPGTMMLWHSVMNREEEQVPAASPATEEALQIRNETDQLLRDLIECPIDLLGDEAAPASVRIGLIGVLRHMQTRAAAIRALKEAREHPKQS